MSPKHSGRLWLSGISTKKFVNVCPEDSATEKLLYHYSSSQINDCWVKQVSNTNGFICEMEGA